MNREPTHQRFFMIWHNPFHAAPRHMRPNIKVPRLREFMETTPRQTMETTGPQNGAQMVG